ncbi:hypothetical protein F4861DRAFT_540119 [Xylaria intraflava]|nr:hypothetical protein F4861DRAFT_540119 [Xylaria intraflava]
MDDNAGRRRHEQPGGSSSHHRYLAHDPNAPRRSYGVAGPDRYRPAPLNAPPNPRGMGGTTSYNGYYGESATGFSQPMTQSTMAYPPEYGQENRQTHGYSAYNTPMLYNVPQPSAQSSVYDASQQFPPRQAAGMHMMPADVATPYFSSEPTNAAAAAGLQPQTASSSTPPVYQQSPPDQRMLHQSYPHAMAPLGNMAQADAPEQVMEEQDAASSAAYNNGELNDAYARYQNALRDVFTNIRNGMLRTASHSLLEVSQWLLANVSELGLVEDNESLLQDRLKLWHDFNHAWLSLCQKQKDMHESDIPLHRTQNLISKEELKHMGDELVRLCDRIERYGLVDYEYGVWEENILDILGQCLDLYDNSSHMHEARPPSNPSVIGEPSR